MGGQPRATRVARDAYSIEDTPERLAEMVGDAAMARRAAPRRRSVGACDADCNNVDIELISMTTCGVVAGDTLPDDYPVVNFKE